MEDAHIAIADLKNHMNNETVDSSISIFGVFDGHGGVIFCVDDYFGF